FFQAVRLLQLLAPRRQPVGLGTNSPGQEVVRFRARLALSFPPSELYDLGWAAAPLDYAGDVRPLPSAGGAAPPTLTVAFLGLTGPLGALPRHVTDKLITLDEARERDFPEKNALRAWLDLFNHRLLSLFYRAWEKYRFYLPYERGRPAGAEPDHFTHALLSLVGLGTGGLRGRLRVTAGRRKAEPLARIDDLALLNYGGFLAQRHRCAVSLEAMLEDHFGVPVRVEQFRGQWLYLDEPRQSSLAAEGGNNQLGVDTVAGTAVWDAPSKFRIRIGPLRYQQFNDFLPDRTPGPARKTFFLLCQLVRLYVGPGLDFEVQLVLAGQDVPQCRLTDDDVIFPRLGWNSWSGPLPGGKDAFDAVFEAEEVKVTGP
ncbi:MAG TPA: type VI secretion system baseplate subunit TssG, partial [Gemmataceae bacterium]|nr:type VI secretion system baseplate subunit TssG [Gemmataceae bacterium]